MDDYIRKLIYLLEQSNREDKHAYLQYLLEMIDDMREMGLSEQ